MSDTFTRREVLTGAVASAALPSALLHPQAGQTGRLSYSLGEAGLASLSYNGVALLPAPENGMIRVLALVAFRRPDGGTATLPDQQPVRTERLEASQSIRLTFRWGVITCAYEREQKSAIEHGDTLRLRLSLHNATPGTLANLVLKILEPVFPAVPNGSILDAGMFGMGGKPHPLHAYPLLANPRAMPPVVLIDYESGTVAYCSDDPASPVSLSIPFTSNPPSNTRYGFRLETGEIPAGKTVTRVVSLRFRPAGATTRDLAGDVLKRYAAAFPFQVRWSDRRPIGTLFLSSAGKHPATNPRGWFNNAVDVDVTTKEGLGQFRRRLLKYADDSIKNLKEMNAQGMITWDPEGQEFSQATYYGDPRLAERLAPETLFKGEAALACEDEFFKRFRDAGLRVGICVRPQEIRFVNGVPQQTDSADATATLKSKIEYARKRWGCTLFYIDSTVKGDNALDADVFRRLNAAFPDVLLMPENETLRYYAYSAPLNSFQHHGVASTPPGAREVYPRAFSVLLAGEGDVKGRRADLVAAVRRGDILLFHGWWPNPNNPVIKSIYEEARRPSAH